MSPLFNQNQSHHDSNARIIEIGIAAGALKPTTGYGFLTMRNHANQIAEALKTGNVLPKIYRKRRFRFYDALLLQMLQENPHRGKAIFERLFQRQPAQLVLKFLDEKTSIWEEIRIFSQLQVPWFLKAVIHYAKH
jgi:lycopene beta-cyclase